MQLIKNKLQVRHYPQLPCRPFCVDVKMSLKPKRF